MKNSFLQFRISDTLRSALEERAAAFGVTVSDYVRSLIIEDMKKEIPPQRTPSKK